MNLNALVVGVLWLIAAYLVLTNASAFNTIVSSGGGFVTQNIALLQGRKIAAGSGYGFGPLSPFTS
jgi:hypothetical protein